MQKVLMNRKKICILVFSEIARDGRVLRGVEYARRKYHVDVIAHGPWEPPEGVRFLPLSQTTWKASFYSLSLLLLGNLLPAAWEKYFWRRPEYRKAIDLLRKGSYDLIHANDLDALPVAVEGARGGRARILFDAHEYSLDAGGETWMTRLRSPFRRYLLKTYGPGISSMITVAEGISNLYRAHFGFESQVIMNAPYYREHEFHPVNPNRINLVYHGGAIPGRNLEDFISLLAKLEERFHLYLMLTSVDKNYVARLEQLAAQTAPERIHFIPPVAPQEVTKAVSRFDIGIPLMRVERLSYFHALPNKFFEYIIGGLAIAVSPLPEMEKIVREHQIGIVSDDQTAAAMAKMLNRLSPVRIDEFKKRSLLLAKSLNGDVEMAKLMDIYTKILTM